MSAVVQSIDAKTAETEQELTDGFHLVIDALKLNDIKTIYGVPGIPITDFRSEEHTSELQSPC